MTQEVPLRVGRGKIVPGGRELVTAGTPVGATHDEDWGKSAILAEEASNVACVEIVDVIVEDAAAEDLRFSRKGEQDSHEEAEGCLEHRESLN